MLAPYPPQPTGARKSKVVSPHLRWNRVGTALKEFASSLWEEAFGVAGGGYQTVANSSVLKAARHLL